MQYTTVLTEPKTHAISPSIPPFDLGQYFWRCPVLMRAEFLLDFGTHQFEPPKVRLSWGWLTGRQQPIPLMQQWIRRRRLPQDRRLSAALGQIAAPAQGLKREVP